MDQHSDMDNDHTDYCRRSNNSRNFKDMHENFDSEVVLENIEEQGFDAILINLVKSYPHLYDTSCKDYRDASKKENAWAEVAGVLNATPQICSTRWTRLRESYSKEKKKRRTKNKSGSGVAQRRGFVYFEAMQFIDEFVKTRSSFGNVKMIQQFGSTRHLQCKDRNESISKWMQQGDINSEIQSSSSQQDIMNVSGSTTSQPTPSTIHEVTNLTEAPLSPSIDFAMNDELKDRSVSTSNKSSPITIRAPLASPTIQEIPKTLKKPPSDMMGRFNPYITIKKKTQNNEFETSFINLNKAVTAYLENKKKSEETSDSQDNSFCNLIMAELNRMNQDEKIDKKRKILNILWENSSPKKE